MEDTVPLDKDAMREYQRKRRQHAKTGATETGEYLGIGYNPAIANDPNHEHYWLRRLGEETATCVDFVYQGRQIIGCGEVRQYEGRLLNDKTDGLPSWPELIRDSSGADEIQKKMPVTKDRR